MLQHAFILRRLLLRRPRPLDDLVNLIQRLIEAGALAGGTWLASAQAQRAEAHDSMRGKGKCALLDALLTAGMVRWPDALAVELDASAAAFLLVFPVALDLAAATHQARGLPRPDCVVH